MNLRVVAIAIASAVIGALIALAIVHRNAPAAVDPDDAPVKAPAAAERVSVENGQTIVTVDAETAAKSHVAVAPLAAAQQSPSTNTYATAVDVRDLVDARNQLDVARAQAAQSRARLVAAQAEFARLKALHDDNHNISDRVLQEAEANLQAEQAGVAAAEATMRAAESGVGQRWGSVVAQAFAQNASWVQDLVANRRVLVQVVSPEQPPSRITLATAGTQVAATYVSPAVRADPHVQGRSWFYLAPAGSIAPGMSLTARAGNASAVTGAIVPRDAVVWADGRPWIYVERAANKFARTEIDASTPMADGYFVASPAAGTRVVVTGAQQLLSEENKPKVEE